MNIQPIKNDEEYFAALETLRRMAELKEDKERFWKLPMERRKRFPAAYERLSNVILRYKGLI